MKLIIIVAASENNVIGKNNQLPWKLPADLRYFKQTTIGKPIIMGRKTWESLGERALPGRLNIVLSSKFLTLPDGAVQHGNLEAAINDARETETDTAYVIGGGVIFNDLLPQTDAILMTRVHTSIEDGDVFFPEIDKKEWKLEWEEKHKEDEKNPFGYTFQRWERTVPKGAEKM